MVEKHKCEPKQSKDKVLVMLTIYYDFPWGFFNRSTQGNPPNCGVGASLYFNPSCWIHIHYAPSLSSNTKAKLVAHFSLLNISSYWGIHKLQAFVTQMLLLIGKKTYKIWNP